jgi:hypothetical protein
MPRGFLQFPVACSLAFALGCSGEGSGIQGKVLWNGNPLPNANVVFAEKGKGAKKSYVGKTDAQGNFDIRLPAKQPINPGQYQVLISKMVDRRGKEPDPEEYGQLEARGELRNMLPLRYSELGSSDLKADLKEGANVLPPFDLKGKAR